MAARSNYGRLETDYLLGAGLLLRGTGGFFDFNVVGADKRAVAAQLVDVDDGCAEIDADSMCLTSSITAATCRSALLEMQPTFRQTPPSWA